MPCPGQGSQAKASSMRCHGLAGSMPRHVLGQQRGSLLRKLCPSEVACCENCVPRKLRKLCPSEAAIAKAGSMPCHGFAGSMPCHVLGKHRGSLLRKLCPSEVACCENYVPRKQPSQSPQHATPRRRPAACHAKAKAAKPKPAARHAKAMASCMPCHGQGSPARASSLPCPGQGSQAKASSMRCHGFAGSMPRHVPGQQRGSLLRKLCPSEVAFCENRVPRKLRKLCPSEAAKPKPAACHAKAKASRMPCQGQGDRKSVV